MKHTLIALAIASLAVTSFAHETSPPTSQPVYNQPNALAQAGAAAGAIAANKTTVSVGVNPQTAVDFSGAKMAGDNSLSFSNPKQVGGVAGIPVPQTMGSCRLFISLFGASVNGTGGGAIPLWNDATCSAGALIAGMERTNQQIPGAFTAADFTRVVCTLDGAGKLDSCKRQVESDRAQAALDGQPLASR